MIRVGYPCINRTIGCTANTTFRLDSYSEENMKTKISNNLACLKKIIEYNIANRILFFRISSDLIPFASHPVCKFDWAGKFRSEFEEIGILIQESGMRISMHPDQFVLLNSPREDVIERSIKELSYHAKVLDLMGLSASAKVQIHVGGAYGDKVPAIESFIKTYEEIYPEIKKRLAIENDDRLFTLSDCMKINEKTGIPIIFDSFHHKCNSSGEKLREGIKKAESTWKKHDGVLMMDYSSQEPGKRTGAHAEHIDSKDFTEFLNQARGIDIDLMLEIKDKEKSALSAIEIMRGLK